MLSSLFQDARYTVGGLRRAPGFTALAVLTLALGVGANTAIYSVVHGVVLAPLPFPQADRIVRIWPSVFWSAEQLAAIDAQVKDLEQTTGWVVRRLTLTDRQSPEELTATTVSVNHFALFGLPPVIGRGFLPADSLPGSDAVILSHELWQSHFAGDPDIVGRALTLEGYGPARRTVVGVAPPSYRPFGRSSAVWLPLIQDPSDEEEWSHDVNLRLVARLRPGATAASANAQVEALVRRSFGNDSYLNEERIGAATVIPHLDALVGRVRPALLLLLGAVAAILLIACANVANLLLARAGARERELAVRAALGAGRLRLLRQLLTESLILALLGGGVGTFAAWTTSSALVSTIPSNVPRQGEIAIDLDVLLFSLLLSLVASGLFGLLPALRSTDGLGFGLRSRSGAARRRRLDRALVAAQVALSLVLVSAAGLMTKSLFKERSADLGFDGEGVLTLRLAPSPTRYDEEADRRELYRQATERLAGLPGVRVVGGVSDLPTSGRIMGAAYTTRETPLGADGRASMAGYRIVLPGYSEALAIPLVAGRRLRASDRAESERVGLVNRALARRHWPDGEAVGKEILFDDGTPWFTIVGVLGDVHERGPREAPRPAIYVPFEQDSWIDRMSIVLRFEGEPEGRREEVLSALRSLDPSLAVSVVADMQEVVSAARASSRFYSLLFSLFAVLALTLAAVGIYGVTASTVSRRRHEIGVRMALGAAGTDVVRATVGGTLLTVGAGAVAGLAISLAVGHTLTRLLYAVRPTDPSVLALVAVTLAAVATAAAWLPARRAARVDPVSTLGSE